MMNIKFRGGLLGLKDFKMILRVTTAQMSFWNFIYMEDDDDDLAFLRKESSTGFGTSSRSALVNTELPKDVQEPEV
ncbi:hypothetical protein Tco_0228433 [Tanacetum coccineum]